MGTGRIRMLLTGALAFGTCFAWARAEIGQQPDPAGTQLCGDYVAVREAVSGRELTSMVDLRARAAMLAHTLAYQPTAGRPPTDAAALVDARRRFADVLRLPNPTARDIWAALRPLGPVCGDSEHWFATGSAARRLFMGK